MKRIYRKIVLLFIFAAVLSGDLQAQARRNTLVKKAPVKTVALQKPVTTTLTEPWKQLRTKERLVEISTDFGVMIAKLYDSTPLHRDNFIKLTEQKFYDSLLFHRVIDQFMIQGGDPLSKNAPQSVPLGGGSAPGEKIPAELKPFLFHKKGALAAARDNNPDRASSNCQFYIVHGKLIPQQELENIFNQRVKPSNSSFNYTKSQKEIYSRVGGTPFLDQGYTVFGEVISGLDIVDKVAKAPKDASDRPLQDVPMKIRLLN